MQQVKRLFAWVDADDETRNMELHMQIAFGLLAEQGRMTQPKWQLSVDELEVRERPLIREVQLTQAYRWERAALATKIARGLHCCFVWIGSLTQDEPTVGFFVGCAPHVDRARLLFELIDPDLRLLTRFLRPPEGKGTGPNGAPSADGMDFYRSRSSAMLDVALWGGERLQETEALAAARSGLVGDFAADLQLAERFVDEMWGDTVNVLARTEGLPDLPMVDGLPAARFREFMEEIAQLEEPAGEGFEGDDVEDDDDDDDDDGWDVEDCDEDDVEEDEWEDDWECADDDGEPGDVEDAREHFSDMRPLPLFDVFDPNPDAQPSVTDATWVYFIEDDADDADGPCLIRFGAGGWQLYYPAMNEWFGDPVLEKMALESGLFRSATRAEAEEWVDALADPEAASGKSGRSVLGEVEKCMEGGLDEESARELVRMRWGNLPDLLLFE